jgi:hypothetical protein
MSKSFKNPKLEIAENGNVIFDKNVYKQVAVWEATIINEDQIDEFEQFIMENLNAKILFLEVCLTKPDFGNGIEVIGTGCRSDIFFAIDVKNSDFNYFATQRFAYGIRWIEDAFSKINGYDKNPIHEERLLAYRTWDADESIQSIMN